MTSENSDDLLYGLQVENFGDKLGGVRHYIRYWLNRTQRIFKYEGLPDTIPARNLELILQCKGSAVIAEVEGALYSFRASLGGNPDVYYQPTLAIVANPALNISKQFLVDKECVLMRNDSCMTGLLPLFCRYASMLAENECTMRMADINTRVQFLLTAPDDRTRKSAEDFLRKLEDGELGVIGDNAFLDGVKVQPAGSGAGSNFFTQLIELEQYLRASCWMDIGLSANFNMKREALNTALPIGVRQVETMRTLLTQSLAVLMPFNVQELNDSTGNYYGINQISKNVNIGNRKKLINGNGFVFGVPGSGKSFFCKMEMGSVFLSGDDEIIVIDPMNEYFDIAETYGGTVVNMSTYTDNYVNPLEMDVWSLDPNDSKGMVREKGEFMLGLCEQCIGDSLNSRQKSIIDRCVRKLYIDIARSKEKYIPVMSDFYDILMAQPEDEAKDIALSLELFVNGSLNIFNHQTNVDVDNRFTVYGIRDLGTELSPITMLVMMESIQNRIVENGKRGKATWLYIDEFHVLLNSEYSAKYLQQLWKKVRKQGGLCTGITQNVVDLLQNYTATTMLANSEFVALLKQANTDSSKMAEVIGVSEAQLRFVTNTSSGMGLIKCGSVVIPFDNQISKDTDLYRLYNTNIHEKIAEQKKKEAMLQ